MRNKRCFILIMACLVAVVLNVQAQHRYLTDRKRSTMMVKGTSNLHDWEMEVRDFTCTLTLLLEPGNMQIQAVRFSAKAGSVKNQSSIMNNKTHDALMTDSHPDIEFQASAPKTLSIHSGSFEGTLTGDLLIAGVTSRITVPVSGEIITDAEMVVAGSVKLRMSDFGISPPTAILGTLKTGDEVTVDFRMVLKENG